MTKRILIIAAHPDDEILGCGGTVANLIKLGYEAYTVILGEGKTSRWNNAGIIESNNEIVSLRDEAIKANCALGIKDVFFFSFPDNRFDSVDLLDIIKEIENIKKRINPDIIFTHHYGDLNIDHQITYKAVLTSTRPMKGESVQSIYTFEIPSSTEWNSFNRETVFVPNIFYNISDTIDLKIKALSEYKSEMNLYPHPRSVQHVMEMSKVNGIRVGLDYSENFMLVRSIVDGGI